MLAPLVDLLKDSARLAVLTGAGCSTESGIPDYRGPGTTARAKNPIEHRAFIGDAATRRRYWARSMVGWPKMRHTAPNAAHAALAALDRAGRLAGLVTQNVDGLHARAGSAAVELHGALAQVTCLACRARSSREALQARLTALNPGHVERARAAAIAPDGDAAVDSDLADFVVPACDACGGVLKPDVVFFGEAVPLERVAASERIVDAADALLVVGSSLAVYSGLRFVRRAAARAIPCALVNLGPTTRGMEHFVVHVDAPCGAVLPALADALTVT